MSTGHVSHTGQPAPLLGRLPLTYQADPLGDVAPGEALKQKREILNWVIFWHYLK